MNNKTLVISDVHAKLEALNTEMYMVHTAPEDKFYKYIKSEISHRDLKNEVLKINRNTILLGHTHLPMVRTKEEKTVLSPSSVGQSRDYGERAPYAPTTDKIELKRVKYNIDNTINKLKSTELEDSIKNKIDRGAEKWKVILKDS